MTKNEEIPVIEPSTGGYYEIYDDGRKIWHKDQFSSDYKPNWEDDVEFPEPDEIDLINQELSLIFQQETDMEIKNPSDYVVPNIDLKDGEYIIIKNEGEYQMLPQDPNKEVLTFKVELPNREIKKLSINPTSQKELLLAWGKDSKNWIGKKCLANVVKQNVRGMLKDVIYLHPEGGISPIPSEQIDDGELPNYS